MSDELQPDDRWRSFDAEEFQRRLDNRFGLNRFDGPRIRLVYGGDFREFKPDGRYGLKYHRTFTRPRLRERGGLLSAVFEREEIGNERWIIERFTEPDDADYPRGRYVFYYEVEDIQGDYREPADDTIEHIAMCLAGEEEAERQQRLELERMRLEEERELEGNVRGTTPLPYGQQTTVATPDYKEHLH